MLVAGVVFLIISLTPIRAWLINSIPKSLKLGIGAGIGLFLAIIGFEIMGLTADNPVTLVQLGDLSNPLTFRCRSFYFYDRNGKKRYQRKHYNWNFSF